MDTATVFDRHYEAYCQKLARCDFQSAARTLGAEPEKGGMRFRFLNQDYLVSGEGIEDDSGGRPGYGACVILAQYVLR